MIFVAIRGDKRVSVTFEEKKEIFNDNKTEKKMLLLYGVVFGLVNEKEMYDQLVYYQNELMVVVAAAEVEVDNDSYMNY